MQLSPELQQIKLKALALMRAMGVKRQGDMMSTLQRAQKHDYETPSMGTAIAGRSTSLSFFDSPFAPSVRYLIENKHWLGDLAGLELATVKARPRCVMLDAKLTVDIDGRIARARDAYDTIKCLSRADLSEPLGAYTVGIGQHKSLMLMLDSLPLTATLGEFLKLTTKAVRGRLIADDRTLEQIAFIETGSPFALADARGIDIVASRLLRLAGPYGYDRIKVGMAALEYVTNHDLDMSRLHASKIKHTPIGELYEYANQQQIVIDLLDGRTTTSESSHIHRGLDVEFSILLRLASHINGV